MSDLYNQLRQEFSDPGEDSRGTDAVAALFAEARELIEDGDQVVSDEALQSLAAAVCMVERQNPGALAGLERDIHV